MYRNNYVMLLVIHILFAAYFFAPAACTREQEQPERLIDDPQLLGELSPNDVSPLLHHAWLSPGGQTALHILEEPSAAHALLSRALHTAAACPVVTVRDVTPLADASATVQLPGAALHLYGLSRVGQLRRLQHFISASAARTPKLVVVLVFENSSLSHGDFVVEWDSWRKQLQDLGIFTTLRSFAIEETSRGKYFNNSRLTKLSETTVTSFRNITNTDNSSVAFRRDNTRGVYILQSTFRPLTFLQVSKHSTLEVSTKFFRNVTNKTTVWDGYDFLSWDTFEKWVGFPLNRSYPNPKATVWNKDVIEHITNNTAHYAFNYHYFTHQRYQLVDFTASVTQFPLCIVLHKAPNVPFSLLLLRPYSLDTWIGMVVSLVVGSFGLCIARHFAIRRSHDKQQNIQDNTCNNGRFDSSTVDDRSLRTVPFLTMLIRGHRDRVNSWHNTKGTILPESLQRENSVQRVGTSDTLSAKAIHPLSVHADVQHPAPHSSRSDSSKQLCVNSTTSTIKPLGRAVFDTAQITLTGGCSRAARNTSQRVLLFALLLAALTLGNAYTGQLLGFLAAPPRYKDPQTLAETTGVVRYLHMPIALPGTFDIEDGPDYLRVLNTKVRISPRTEMDSWVKYIANHGQDGYVLPDIDYNIYSRMKQMTVDDEVILHMVPECVLSPGHGAFLVKKKSPLFDLLNDFVLRIVGAGLYDYWIHMQLSHMTKEGQLVPEHASKKEPQPLRVEQVTGPFVLLAVGLGVATLIFVLELFGKVNFRF